MPPAGLIFDIQRTSLHDGPGIRTTVFLKGCPLRCAWCHNPESQSRGPEIYFRPESCAFCGECVKICPQGAHKIEGGVHTYDRSVCQKCGKCTEACLYGALKLTGRPFTVEQVMQVVRRDRAYYERSGGGLTVSGGEPMLQPAFTRALLAAAKKEGFHTCLDTSGWGSRRSYEKVLPYVDLFLFDYKATDASTHRRLIGVSNSPILATLDYLYSSGARVRLRCPLVPCLNDTPDHLEGIAALDRRYPNLEGIDLMPYHNAGNSKYETYGLPNPLPDLPSVEETTKRSWLRTLHQLGCEKAILG